MTVEELISLNENIGDVVIEVRDNGSLVWVYRFGKNVGDLSPNAFGGPRTEIRKKMTASAKPINSKDNGKDYYEILVNRIPENVRKLEVTAFSSHRAYRGIYSQHELEEIWITAKPDSQLTIGKFMKEAAE